MKYNRSEKNLNNAEGREFSNRINLGKVTKDEGNYFVQKFIKKKKIRNQTEGRMLSYRTPEQGHYYYLFSC